MRLKIETMTVPAKQQTVYEPHDGPMGLFGWNTVPASAEEVCCLVVITQHKLCVFDL